MPQYVQMMDKILSRFVRIV